MTDLFNVLWEESQDAPMVTQEPNELHAAFCLMKGYDSFLEVGSCYGTSLYILSHALKTGARIVSVDLCEEKSFKPLYETVNRLNAKGYNASILKGNSHEVEVSDTFDVVFIDADHSYESVKKDVEKYKPLCKSLFLMHDVRMDGPGRVFKEIGGSLQINSTVRLQAAPDVGFGAIWV